MRRTVSFSGSVSALLVGLVSSAALAIQGDPIQSGQGTALHGTVEHGDMNIPFGAGRSPEGAPCTVSFAGGELGLRCPSPTGDLSGSHLVGATFRIGGTPAITFTIKDVKPHASIFLHGTVPPPPPTSEYEVRVTVDGREQDLCVGPATHALAVPGRWIDHQLVGSPTAPPTHFTFACVPFREDGFLRGGGVITKCVDWGYPPWPSSSPPLISRIDSALVEYSWQVARRFHRTCLSVATADYCGEGESNTVDGTPIGIADLTNVDGLVEPTTLKLQPSPPYEELTVSTFSRSPFMGMNDRPELEAIWGAADCDPSNKDCNTRGRILCVSRARWATLSLAATCLDRETVRRMLAPRGGECDGPGAEFCSYIKLCDDWTFEDMRREGATLFSYSASWDRPLVRFQTGDERHVTTSKVAHVYPPALTDYRDDRNGFTLNGAGFARAGFPLDKVGGYEGKIFKTSLPASIRPRLDPLVKLYRCKKGNQYLVTTESGESVGARCTVNGVDSGYTMEEPEGYIYGPGHSLAGELDALYLWQQEGTAGVRFATSRDRPFGYHRVGAGPLGYLPGRKQPPLELAPPEKLVPAPRRCGMSAGGAEASPFGLLLGASLLFARRTRRGARWLGRERRSGPRDLG